MFIYSNPLVTISIGLVIDKKLVIGIVSAPCIGKLFAAVKGKGATLNGKPMKVSDCTKLSLAQCIFEIWSRDGPESEARQLANIASLIPKVHSFRSLGKSILC